ncbi:MAG: lipid-A-disaccharide synthase [Luteitalea sp.]|nr:lipid-A-disaccharide synthase [Luteitalea sp.]
MPSVLISCGEPSGDLYAAALVETLRAIDPSTTAFGFGGPRLAAAGATLIGDYRGYAVTGLAEVIRQLPRTYGMYRHLVAEARARRPDVFVAVDFPDFNFRLGGALHGMGIPVVYYISPQLWAWRPGRLAKMKRFVEHVLVIFPFEETIYREAGIPVTFVGHPLVELIHVREDRAALLSRLELQPDAPTIALLPGSRPNEVRAILPELLAAARLIADAEPRAQFVVARAPGLDDALFGSSFSPPPVLSVVEGATDELLAAADAVVTASGTATVQTALHEKPMVIVYRLSPLTYALGKRLVKVDTYGMVNLVAGRKIVPELIQNDFTSEGVAAHTLRYLHDPVHREATRDAVREVKTRLGGPGATRRAAEAILRVAG